MKAGTILLSGDCRRRTAVPLPPAARVNGNDVLIVDPPYSAHTHKSAVSQHVTAGKDMGVRKRDLGFDCLSPEMMAWICAYAARVKRWSIIFTDIESVGAWKDGLTKAGAHYIRAIPWVRWSMPQLSGDRPPQGSEMIVVAHAKGKGRKHWNGPGNLTHLNHLCLRGEGKHKAEKPLDLMLDLVSWFSDEGETVVDPMMGSGTTGVAAAILKRGFVGCELSAEWHAKASARIKMLPALSERDQTRLDRWRATQVTREADANRRAAHTAKVRARLESA